MESHVRGGLKNRITNQEEEKILNTPLLIWRLYGTGATLNPNCKTPKIHDRTIDTDWTQNVKIFEGSLI